MMDHDEGARAGDQPKLRTYRGAATERARRLATMFQALDVRRHGNLYVALAEAALIQQELASDEFECATFIEEFEQRLGRKPKGPTLSHDVLYFVTGATTREAVRTAGTYAMVVDYMIAHKVRDFLSYLKRHCHSALLEKAREKKSRGQRARDVRPVVRIYLNGATKDFLDLLKDPPELVEFDLKCRVQPGHRPKIIASRTQHFRPSQPNLSAAEQKLHQRRLKRVADARAHLEDCMLYAAGWPETEDV